MEAPQVSGDVPAAQEFMCKKCGIEIDPECKKDDSANFVDPQSSKAMNQKEIYRFGLIFLIDSVTLTPSQIHNSLTRMMCQSSSGEFENS